MQKKGKIRNEDRTAKACETEISSKVDFVYKVRLENFTDDLSAYIYTMRVVELIKEVLGKLRPFLSYQDCRETLNLKGGKTYLVMGITRDIYKDEENQLYQYLLGERTWIEYWPTEAQCQTKKYRQTCTGMEDLLDQLRIFGCQF